MSKQPFMPLFFGDFLAATSEWEGEECSLYLTLLGHQWSLGSLPPDPAKLCRLVRWERKLFDRCWPQVSVKFKEAEGRLYNDRLEDHRAKSAEISNKNSASGKKGAEARWRKDSERHDDANSENMATATKSPMATRHTKVDGVTNGNPSHPIPSHPIPIHPIPIHDSVDRSAGADTSVGARAVPDTNHQPMGKRGSAEGEALASQADSPMDENLRTDENPAKVRRQKKDPVKHKMPEPFELTDERRSYAEQQLPDADVPRLFEDFKLKAERGGWKYVNWDRAWQTWCRDVKPGSGHWSEGHYPKRKTNGRAPADVSPEWRLLREEASRVGFRFPIGQETPDQFRAALKQHNTKQETSAVRSLDLTGALKGMG